MGEVYRAHDLRLVRRVALKRIRTDAAQDPRARRRFRREARLAASLDHPGIVRIFDVFEDRGSDWIVMEWVDGRALSEVLDQAPLEIEQAREFAHQITDALAAAHDRGIVHRDLKAGNILLTPDGRLKVLDFGLAKEVISSTRTTSISVEGQVVGTPHSMSPEQAMGQKVDLRSDLFSLGALIYQMITGAPPFLGPDSLTTLNRICLMDPPLLREVAPATPRVLSELVERLLRKDPAARPRSALEVLASLATVQPVLPSARTASSESPTPEPAPTTARSEDGRPGEALPPTEPLVMRAAHEADTATITEPRRSAAGQSDEDVVVSAAGERRQLTVLSCELVEARGSSGSLDPETLFQVMADFEMLAKQVLTSLDGYLAHLLGHQLVAYFGFPQAHEDGARRAVTAGLALIACTRNIELSVRIGIHTGWAVVGTNRRAALGETLDLATGLHRAARPQQLLVSETTRRLVVNDFDTRELGAMMIEGGHSIRVTQILEEREPFPSSPAESEAALRSIGRREELATLVDHWRRAQDGQGGAVRICGEAGIGKTHLLASLARAAVPDGTAEGRVLLLQGRSEAQDSPLAPIIRCLPGMLGAELVRGASPGEGRRRLKESLLALDPHGTRLSPDAATRLAQLLGFSDPSELVAPVANPEREGRRRSAILTQLLLVVARNSNSLLLIVEDLHWMDASTQELVGSWIGMTAEAPILLVSSHRPDFEPPWAVSDSEVTLQLGRLSRAEVDRLLDRCLQEIRIPRRLRERLIDKADGNPLFAEELAQSVLETEPAWDSSEDPARDLTVPETLRDLLASRLDRLGTAKAAAQVASVLGRDISEDLLRAVTNRDDSLLAAHLDRLVAVGLLRTRDPSPAGRRFQWKHALFRDAAYESMPALQRREVHERVATVLEEQAGDRDEAGAEALARHWQHCGRFDRAAPCFRRAADQAKSLFANAEAVHLYRQAVSSLEKLEGHSQLPELAHAYENLGDLMTLERRLADALNCFERFGELASDPLARARSMRKKANAFQTFSESKEALDELVKADLGLGEAPGEGSEVHWQEWIAIRLVRMMAYHRAGDLAAMLEVMNELQPAMEAHGSFEQKIELWPLRIAIDLRQRRFRTSPETLRVARDYLALCEEQEDQVLIVDARSTLGLTLLLAGELEEATDVLETTLEAAEALGESSIVMVALAFRSTVERRQDRAGPCRRTSRRLLDREASAQYHGLAHAHLSWAAWKEADREKCRSHGESALECWQAAPYVFEWTGRLPFAAALLAGGELERALDVVASVIEPSQEALPESVEEPIAEGLRACAEGDLSRAERELADALGQAIESGHL